MAPISLALFATVAAIGPALAAAGSLQVEVFGNSVMRGALRCKFTTENGFRRSDLHSLCQGGPPLPGPGEISLRITGTLTAPCTTPEWFKFGATTEPTDWIRLWVDDHRLIDRWSNAPHSDPRPVTPSLLPNVSLAHSRPVNIRVDIRPWRDATSFGLFWTQDAAAEPRLVPAGQLAPTVSAAQANRRALQERAATGWGQWDRKSNLAQIVLPQQLGIDLGIKDRTTGKIHRCGLLYPQVTHQGRDPPVPVRMGHHSYGGAYSHVSLVPFPAGTANVSTAANLNISVQNAAGSMVSAAALAAAAAAQPDNAVLVNTNATTAAEATAANLSLVVYAQAFYGAQAVLSRTGDTLTLDAGELGTVTVSFSGKPLPPSSSAAPYALPPSERATHTPNFGVGQPAVFVELPLTADPLAIALSFDGSFVNVAAVEERVAAGEAAVVAEIEAAAATVGGGVDAYDAMMTVIAWNVNFDPRVAVTAPVSRTFEEAFDFIFFDWDMFMLSLMAGTLPAASNPRAFDIAVSNLIEVAQTRSAYGHVMNKRAASGSSSSDSNDRTEPLVGSMIVQRMVADAAGTTREATMAWVAELLFPTLLGWNQWAWNNRRYNVTETDPGLLVLGSDNNEPCEGSTVGLNSSNAVCANKGATILESGMDNSPMYYYAFDPSNATLAVQSPSTADRGTASKLPPYGPVTPPPSTTGRVAASYDANAGRLQLYDCQQSALFVSESRALQKLAVATAGNGGAVATLSKQASAITANIGRLLWDEATGIYRQYDASPLGRGHSPVISPTSFYPMIAGIPTTKQVLRMVTDHLTNASEFCVDPIGGPDRCPYALPSISRADPHFHDNDYWRGRAWGPLNLLVWIALAQPEYAGIPAVSAARKGLVKQSHSLLMVEWHSHRRVHENYNSTTGIGGGVINSNPFYHWGAALGYIGFREAIEFGV